MQRKRTLLVLGVLALWIVPPLFFLAQQWREERLISAYLAENGLLDLPFSKASAVAVSSAVRRDFQNDESQFAFIDMNDRPFLRETAGDLLLHREGLCDAGTRVIVNLLTRLGYDATRLTLYNKNLESTHTLVSVVLGDREFLVDSIGSPPGVTELTVEKDIRTDMFNVLHYSDNSAERRQFRLSEVSDEEQLFFSEYWLYSYEALPFTKLLTKLGVDARIFNFDRPLRFLSVLAEKPNLLVATAWLILLAVPCGLAIYWSAGSRNR